MNSLKAKFEAADTQVLGISIDSVHCHKGWASTFGGIDFPLLADFNPKGAVAEAFGMMLKDAGISDRGTVLVGKNGDVLWAESVTPAGARVPGDLLAKAQELGS